MKHLSALLLLAVSWSAMADETDYAKNLRDKGFQYCAGPVNTLTNWLVGEDAATLSLWNDVAADKHVGVLIASVRDSAATRFLHLTATRTSQDGCDISFSLQANTESSCASVRETVFKGWKFYGDVGGVTVYDDPSTPNVQVVLRQTWGVCQVTKFGLAFWGKDEVNAKPK